MSISLLESDIPRIVFDVRVDLDIPMLDQLATDPSVVTNFPLLPVCAGSAEENAVAATNAVEAALVELSPAACVATVTVAPVNTCDPVHVSPALRPRSSMAV
jgi:hypothetical protein